VAEKSPLTGPRLLTVVGLVVGAVGIGILWASGIVFPFYPPPGILILTAGVLFVVLAPWRWAPIVGTLLGLFVIVGFLVSPTGIDNLTGESGASVSIGSVIQLLGVVTAAVSGVLALAGSKAKAAK